MFNRIALTIAATAALALPGGVNAQESLEQAARQLRSAFLAHDVERLLRNSESVTLRLEGFRGVANAGSRQAGRVLKNYLAQASEVGFRIVGVRKVGARKGVVEARRRYVVRGTSDELSNVVFVTFRRLDSGHWVVGEIRVGG